MLGGAIQVYGLQGGPAAEETVPEFESIWYDSYVEWISDYFRDEDDDSLSKLKNAETDIVAIISAWELSLRRLEEPMQPEVEKKLVIGKFIGFCEGRLRVTIPSRWRDVISHSDFGAEVPFLLSPDSVDSGEYSFDAQRTIYVARGVEIEFSEAEGYLKLLKEKDEIVLSASRVGAAGNRKCYNLFCDGNDSIVLIHHLTPGSFKIFSVNRTTSKVRWEAIVKGGMLPVFSKTPEGFHEVYVAANTKELYVFGVNKFGFYIEAFGRESGKSVFRFDSTVFRAEGK